MNWLRTHWKACQLALTRLAAAPLNTLLSVVGIGIALALPGAGQQLLAHVAALSQNAAATPQLTVFLNVDAERKTTQAIETRLKGLPEAGKTQLIAREDTLARMKKAEGLADVIAALPKNPFPDAIVVTPADDAPATIESLATTVRQWREVEHVQVDADWARRLSALIRLAKTGVLLLATLLGIGLVTITFNTIRLQVLTRQTEVEVSRLLGATDAFHPSALPLVRGTARSARWLRGLADRRRCNALAAPAGGRACAALRFRTHVGLPSATDSALLLGAATILGWLGAALSMRQHLR